VLREIPELKVSKVFKVSRGIREIKATPVYKVSKA